VTVAGVALLALAVGPAQPAAQPALPVPSFWPPPVLSNERAIAEVLRVDSRGGGAFDTGTGVSVGAHVVLTNAHLTRNALTLVTRCGAHQLPVDHIERPSGDDDVALLVTTGPNLLPVELASRDPRPGDKVLLPGYPGGQLELIEGRVDGSLHQDSGDVLRFSPEPESGQSGSPLLDVDGRVAGLAFAREAAGGQGLAIPASRLRALLERSRADGIPVAAADVGDPASAQARSSVCG
jgi:S1-C subfamily serine protease